MFLNARCRQTKFGDDLLPRFINALQSFSNRTNFFLKVSAFSTLCDVCNSTVMTNATARVKFKFKNTKTKMVALML